MKEIALNELYQQLKSKLENNCPPLQLRKQKEDQCEFAGTKPAMQGKQKVDGYYFASVMTKPKDIRFYFFPIYTHPAAYSLSEPLQKMLKGKSCFHLKKVDSDILREIENMIDKGVALYEEEGLI